MLPHTIFNERAIATSNGATETDRMGGVQSLDRGEIGVQLGPPAIASTPVEKLLGDTGVINVLKVPKVRNENWERAKPAFKPLLEEALQIRATILKEGRGLHRGKLETALGRTRKSTPGPGGTAKVDLENTPGGWLERAETTLGEYGLQCFLDIRQLAFAIVDPKSPEEVPNCCHDWCCGLC